KCQEKFRQRSFDRRFNRMDLETDRTISTRRQLMGLATHPTVFCCNSRRLWIGASALLDTPCTVSL
ncbi:MAG TPA: hypothetical protein PKH07_17745, partial [bacterium]|nr:hypothetical protein [bacterium]